MEAKKLYLELNKLFCDALFNERMEMSRVFLDLDSLSASGVKHLLVEGESEVAEVIVRCIRDLIHIPDSAAEKTFRHFDRFVREWEQNPQRVAADRQNPPPVIPLLLVFVLAAEQMGQGGENSNNYYVHLLDLLQYPKSKTTWLQQDFKETVTKYFNLLADWLDEFLGEIGVPTFPGPKDKDYVGICIRQALIRNADRLKLHRVFQKQGFESHQELTTDFIAELLMDWNARDTGSLSTFFWRHFDYASTKGLLVEAVRTELLRWDGSTTTSAGQLADEFGLMLGCNFSNGFFGTQLEFEYIAKVPNELLSVAWNSSVSSEDVWLSAIGNGSGLLNIAETIDFISADISLHSKDGDFKIKRRAERFVVLGLDDITGKYFEQKNIKLGQKTLILAIRLDAQIVEQLDSYLTNYARAGYGRLTIQDLEKLPEGWVLYTDVELLAQPDATLNPTLKKLSQTASLTSENILELQGGIRLEGIQKNYLAGYLPNVLAVSSGNVSLKVVVGIISAQNGSSEREFSASNGSLLINLNDMNIESAAVKISMFVGLAERPNKAISFRSYTLDGIRHLDGLRVDSIVYRSKDDNKLSSVLGFKSDEEAQNLIDLFGMAEPKIASLKALPRDFEGALAKTSPTVQAKPKLEQSICFTRGHHIWNLGKALPNPTKWTLGKCECGEERLFYSKPIDITRTADIRILGTSIDLEKEIVKKVAQVGVEENFNIDGIRKMLTFSRSGSKELLTRLLSQFSSQIEVNNLAYILEIMGHINLQRSRNGNLESWSINPYTELRDESGLVYSVGALGHSNRIDGEVVSSQKLALEIGLRTPNLSQIAECIPDEKFTGAPSLDRFDVDTLLYEKVPNLLSPGAFRIRTPYGNKYAFIKDNSDGIDNLKFGPAALVKHLEANNRDLALVAYSPDDQCLIVPFGCELLGSFGKMIGILSPNPPRRIQQGKRNFWVHGGVGVDVATILNSKLRG